jgi:hypothetical protein
MMQLFCEVDGLFPSVYQFYDSDGQPALQRRNKEYVFTNVQEAVRIARQVPARCQKLRVHSAGDEMVEAAAAAAAAAAPPVWVYCWLRYHASGSPLVSTQDAQMYWEQSYAAGATGLVLCTPGVYIHCCQID